MGYEEVVAKVAGRARLVAVSKGATLEQVRAVFDAGQRDFGENRADALAARAASLPREARWHFIGNLQSRDLRRLRELEPLVHSFDRPDLVARWPVAVPVLVQVDFTGRPERNGVAPADVPALVDALRARGIEARGLSTLPPKEGDPRAVFRALSALRDELGLEELSMGMSEDYEIAIEEGATMVRVGRAIFAETP
ncbi:MAG TPA: alanine racemase [Candidatus Thermoplasmatota archaeon]|nr:alanine racemase [Candidatus Thermoplasmatota archaeon]